MIQIAHVQIPWFSWTGEQQLTQTLYDVTPKQSPYEQFQHISCPAASYSKMSCNSNISMISIRPRPIAQYQFKYYIKDTQRKMRISVKLMLSKEDSQKNHDEDKAEEDKK